MTEDKLAFLDGSPAEEEPITTTEDVSPEAPSEQPRGPDGKFAAKEDKGEDKSAPPALEPERPREVPITALLDEREKRQKLEAELERYRQQQKPQIPDVIENQEGFQSYILQQQLAIRDDMEAQFSERMARKEFGAAFVDEALQAAMQANAVNQFRHGIDRWERMCEWHKRNKALAEIGPDPETYKTKLREQLAAEIREQVMAEMQGARPKPPPTSLAAAPATGSSEPGGAGTAFDRAFPG